METSLIPPDNNNDSQSSSSTDENGARKKSVKLDLNQLEMLRDMLSLKVEGLKLLKPTRSFSMEGAEQQAVKRELMDFIITLFGYLTQNEAQDLVQKISKEHNFRIQAVIAQSFKNKILKQIQPSSKKLSRTLKKEEDRKIKHKKVSNEIKSISEQSFAHLEQDVPSQYYDSKIRLTQNYVDKGGIVLNTEDDEILSSANMTESEDFSRHDLLSEQQFSKVNQSHQDNLQPGQAEHSVEGARESRTRVKNVTSEYQMRTAAPHQVAVEAEMIQRLRGLQSKLNSLVKKIMKRTKVGEQTSVIKPLIKMSISKGSGAKEKNTSQQEQISKNLLLLTKSASSIQEQISNKEDLNSIDGSVKDKFAKIMDDFKILTKDFHIDESFEYEGERFPYFKEISRQNDIDGGVQRNSMHEISKSKDYIIIDAAIPKQTKKKTSQIIFEENTETPDQNSQNIFSPLLQAQKNEADINLLTETPKVLNHNPNRVENSEEKISDDESSIFVPKFLDHPPHDESEEQMSSIDNIGDIRSSTNSVFRLEEVDHSPITDINTPLAGQMIEQQAVASARNLFNNCGLEVISEASDRDDRGSEEDEDLVQGKKGLEELSLNKIQYLDQSIQTSLIQDQQSEKMSLVHAVPIKTIDCQTQVEQACQDCSTQMENLSASSKDLCTDQKTQLCSVGLDSFPPQMCDSQTQSTEFLSTKIFDYQVDPSTEHAQVKTSTVLKKLSKTVDTQVDSISYANEQTETYQVHYSDQYTDYQTGLPVPEDIQKDLREVVDSHTSIDKTLLLPRKLKVQASTQTTSQMDYRNIDLQTSFEIKFVDKEEILFTEEQDEQPLKMNFMYEERKQNEGATKSEESSMEIIPLQLRKEVAFKRGYKRDGNLDKNSKCRIMMVVKEQFIFVDGLNGNVDVFNFDNLQYCGTLDIEESQLTSALYFSEFPSVRPRLYLATMSKQLYVFEHFSHIENGSFDDLFRLQHVAHTSEVVTFMKAFNQFQLKNSTFSILCSEENAIIEIFDHQCNQNFAKFKIFTSKKPFIEDVSKINFCLKTQPPGMEIQQPGSVQVWSSPEITVGTDQGLWFMNVRISKTMPQMNSVYLKEDQIPDLKGQEIKSIAQATSNKLIVLSFNKTEEFDSIYIVDRDQKPVSLFKIPLVCNLLDPLTKSSTPTLFRGMQNIRFSAMRMLKNLDDSVLIFDQQSGTLILLDLDRKDLKILVEGNALACSQTSHAIPYCVDFFTNSTSGLVNLVTLSYEEATGSSRQSTMSLNSSMSETGAKNKVLVNTCLKRYETNENFLKAVFFIEDLNLQAASQLS